MILSCGCGLWLVGNSDHLLVGGGMKVQLKSESKERRNADKVFKVWST